MKIIWNRVTWYSKLIALALFVIIPIFAFFLGVKVGFLQGEISLFPANSGGEIVMGGSPSSTDVSNTSYYENTSTWQTYTDDQGQFSIAYPIDFMTTENYANPAPTTDWQMLGGSPGTLSFTLTVPAAFEPQTNFADAKLTVGWSANDVAVAQCMNVGPSGDSPNSAGTSTITINNATFTVFHFSDAGAGNYYETTSYRTLHAGRCYAVEYTVHSNQIGNYPPSYQLQPFREAQIHTLLDRIVGTFKFE